MYFIIKLRKYNLRAKNKIMFYGIDLEYQKNITKKMLNFTSNNNLTSIFSKIKNNLELTNDIANLKENQYEVLRERLLINNFMEDYFLLDSKNLLCFMGAWHIVDNSKNNNFVKSIRKRLKSALSLEIKYISSKRTIIDNKHFKVIDVDDMLVYDKYNMFENIGILKTNSLQGIIILNNCHQLKMI